MRRALPFSLVAALVAALPFATACGGGAYPSAASPYGATVSRSAVPGLGEGDSGGGSYDAPAQERELYAQLRTEPATTATGAEAGASTSPTPATATDARDLSGPLLIYTATLHMAVFEVRATQAQLVERARAMGGLLFVQTDDRLVVRVPAARFDEYLAGVGELGDVLHRDVQAQDVGEEFRDVAIRIRNLEVTRQRIEALLAQARTVEEALAVQRELERVTTELEALRGRQRYLADRIALSTITFVFQPRPREALEQPEIFQLPFGWLEQLGLSTLLEVR